MVFKDCRRLPVFFMIFMVIMVTRPAVVRMVRLAQYHCQMNHDGTDAIQQC